MAKCRVGLKPITVNDIERVAQNRKVKGYDALKEAVKEFLAEELKFDSTEMEMIKDFEVTRKDTEDNDKVYVIFKKEEMCDYIYRKAQICRNDCVNVFPFIPPQIFQRYSDLSRNCFRVRKADPRVKTMIKLGENDFVLKSKIKNETE